MRPIVCICDPFEMRKQSNNSPVIIQIGLIFHQTVKIYNINGNKSNKRQAE